MIMDENILNNLLCSHADDMKQKKSFFSLKRVRGFLPDAQSLSKDKLQQFQSIKLVLKYFLSINASRSSLCSGKKGQDMAEGSFLLEIRNH